MASSFSQCCAAWRTASRVVCGIALLLAAGLAFPQQLYKRDIAIMNHALAAKARPGEKWIRFGDVGITRERLQEFRDRLARGEADFVTPGGTAFQWPGGNVYYRFNPAQVGGVITAAKMQQFRDAIAEWAGWANVTFTESIAGQTNYITVREDAALGGGFSSAVGMGGGEQFLDFGPNAWNRGTICHEIGHALGLWHEMQRTDRDTYVVIHFSNIPTGAQPNFVIIPGSTNHGAYDFLSVMHYERNALAINPAMDTISMQPGFTQFADLIGRVYYRTLSKLDRKGMSEVYGNPSPLPSAVVTNTKDSGRGSLRNAIYFAFDRSTDMPPVATTVSFNIPLADPGFSGGVFTIKPTSLMVAPGAGTTIDGATQTAFTGDTNASGPEIVLEGSQYAAQNVFAPGLALVTTNCAVRNLILYGFSRQAINIDGAIAAQNGDSASNNTIAGCYIGTDKTGTIALGNGNVWPGIEIFGGAGNNTIGGTTASARNVISGSSGYGIVIQQTGTNGNVIAGNYIGTNATGTAALANTWAGVGIYGGAKNNTIGGVTAGARNVLSGNKRQGFIFADANTTGNIAQGNYVGLNAAGTAAIPNGNENFAAHFFYPGAAIFNGAQNNTIGPANIISGNTGQGIIIADPGTTGNTVQGNYIGTNPAGTGAIGNGFADPPNFWLYAGLSVFGGAQSNTLSANVISGNAAAGVTISDNNTNTNIVAGNYIGTNASGTAAIANAFEGVAVFGGAQSNVIGGLTNGAGNVLSGNGTRGVGFFEATTTNNLVQGNLIGLNAAGTGAIANGFSGVECFLASNNTIGGTNPAARNFISGNADRGVVLDGADATGNKVIGNTIGRTCTGAAVPNGTQGVALFTGAHGNFIGGSLAGESNIISANTQEGIALYDAATTANTISRNSIYANAGVGIGRYTGSNNNQPAPVLTSATLSPPGNVDGMTVNGSITGAATIEFFASPPGGDEGQFFIGTFSAPGGSFSVPLTSSAPSGYVISATATASGSTSQFSNLVTNTATDTDGDGLPDNWMLTHFGHTDPRANDLSRADDDADGDGLTNIEELRAGTDPLLATSGFRIIAVSRTGTDFGLTFSSVIGKTYRVDYKDDFVRTDWRVLQDQIAATGASTSITDFGASLSSSRAYRVSLEP